MLKAWDLTKNKLRHNCFDNIMQNIFRIITLENGTGQIVLTVTLTLLRMGFFGGCSRMGGGGGGGRVCKKVPLPKICHTYPIMMKLDTVIPYLKKIQKIYESCDTPIKHPSAFFHRNQQVLLYQETQI